MSDFRAKLPVVLTIAGSDNTGGAGIQADIKTCSRFGVYSASVITAVTAQNAQGVRRVNYVGDNMLTDQLEATLEQYHPDAVKIGMLGSSSALKVIAYVLSRYNLKNIVVDTVLSSTAGGSLSGNEDFISSLCNHLLPLATLITPNLPEFRILSGQERSDSSHVLTFMKRYGIKGLLLKGGHMDTGIGVCTDLLYTEESTAPESFESGRIDSPNTHGTGCVLSSAIACGLAKGAGMHEAVSDAKQFITNAIRLGKDYPVTDSYGPLYLL